MIVSVSLPIRISMLLLFEYIVRVTLKTLEEKMLIAIVNWIFHSPWVL